jgi:hypothetical protein
LKVPFYAAAIGNRWIWTDQPSAVTEADTGVRTYVDLTNVATVNMSGRVDTVGHTTAVLATQYFRESDTTWRYLDGTAGPQLLLSATGDIDGAGVRVEADARTRVLIRLVGSGGNATADPEVGNVFLNAAAAASGTVPTSGTPPLGDGYDWNPLEGSGTTITDKNGSGISATLSGGTWVTDGVRYDHLGTFNYEYASVTSDALTMAQSSVMLYAKMPPAWNNAQGWFCGREPGPGGNDNDRSLYIDASGNVHANIVQSSGTTNKTVDSSTTFGVDDEMCLCWTHDGVTLRLYVNGVEEDSIACSDATVGTPTFFYIAAGAAAVSPQEPPSNGGLFGSTGTIVGRVRLANRGWTPSEVAALYAEFKIQYPGLP